MNRRIDAYNKVKQIERVATTPMGDDNIKKYLPDTPIIVYSDLQKYRSIEDILPRDKSYAILLYQDSPNSGHWVAVMRYNDVIEFFDSYGGKPDSQLKWVNQSRRHQLGITDKYLSRLLDNTDLPVIYNKVKYQDGDPDVTTCGRHVVWRILNMLKKNMDLKQYNKMMKGSGLPADLIVSEAVDDI